MNENEIITEITFEEEFSCLEKDVKDFFGNYENESGGEDCIEVCLIRNGYRAAKKAREEINRQKAEIEALKESVREHAETLSKQNVQIKMLQKENEAFAPLGKFYSEIKSEARKEFAERLTDRISDKLDRSSDNPDGDNYFITDVFADIENLLAEMESERE